MKGPACSVCWPVLFVIPLTSMQQLFVATHSHGGVTQYHQEG